MYVGPKDIEAKTGTIPPRNVPTAGTNWDNNPAEIPRANGEGRPIIRKAIVKTMLAKMPRITPVSYTHLTLPTKRIV